MLKSGLGRITENTEQYQGVVVYSMADVPLVSPAVMRLCFYRSSSPCNNNCFISQGFGVAAKSTQECRRVDPMAIVVFHQADVGEFIRNEDTLT